MDPFLVSIEGVTEPEKDGKIQGRWVLAVDPVGDRLLVADVDKSLAWYPRSQCKFVFMRDPTAAQPVVVVDPRQQQGRPSGLTLPGANGQQAV